MIKILKKLKIQIILFTIIISFSITVYSQKQYADLIIINAKVHTMDKKDKEAEAIAIKDNKILAVGRYNKITKLVGTKTKRIDAREQVVIPGFDDSHVHFMGIGNSFSTVDLKTARSPQDVVEILREDVKYLPKGRWILGGQWNNENWTPNDLPTKELIDAVTPENPVFLYNAAGNIAWVNSLALKIAGVDKNRSDIEGGKIVRDEKGEPTGILKDKAILFVKIQIPKYSTEQLQEMIQTASNYAASLGITSVQNVHTDDLWEILHNLENEGNLKTRVYDCAPLVKWKKLADAGIQRATGDAMIRRGCLKYFTDEATDSIPDLVKIIGDADRANLQVFIHAIGNSDNEKILTVFEQVFKENGAKDRRFRIEHAYGFNPENLKRFSRSDIIASLQPHLFNGGQPYEALLDSNAKIAFGSDAAISDFNPMLGIHDAVTGAGSFNGKSQNLSVEEAVYLYTMGSAYAEFQEDVKGSITPGKLADLVILSDDIFEINKEDIPKTRVLMTIVDGKIVYNERNFTTVRSPNVR
ncbi:MAG: amidohydrolase [Aridibacter sp.]